MEKVPGPWAAQTLPPRRCWHHRFRRGLPYRKLPGAIPHPRGQVLSLTLLGHTPAPGREAGIPGDTNEHCLKTYLPPGTTLYTSALQMGKLRLREGKYPLNPGAQKTKAAELGRGPDAGPPSTPPRLASRCIQVSRPSSLPPAHTPGKWGQCWPRAHHWVILEGRGQGALSMRNRDCGKIGTARPPHPALPTSAGTQLRPQQSVPPASRCPPAVRRGHLASSRALLVTGAHSARGSLFHRAARPQSQKSLSLSILPTNTGGYPRWDKIFPS